MSMLMRRVSIGPVKLVALAAVLAGALFAMGLAGSPAAHADEPPSPQAIIVGNQLNITTNKSFYHVGEWAQICYTVPGPGYIEITDHQGGSVKTLLSGYDDGNGDCFWGQVTPPFGQETLKIRYYLWYGGSVTDQTSFQVYPSFPYPFPF